MVSGTQTREQQLEMLRKMGEAEWFARFESIAWLLVVMLVLLGIWKSWVPCYMVALFIGVVMASTRVTMASVRNAIRGEREGRRVRARVEIVEQPEGESRSWYATTDDRGVRWKLDFVSTGWAPADGTYAAELVYLFDVEWPVLVLLDDGIVIPRYQPKRVY